MDTMGGGRSGSLRPKRTAKALVEPVLLEKVIAMEVLETDPLIEHGLSAAVRAGLFRTEQDALRQALATWFTVKAPVRLEVAIELFKEEVVTLNRAAEIAGMNRWLFQDVLAQRGVRVEIEADTPSVLKQATAAIRRRSR